MSRILIIKSNPATVTNVVIRDLGFDVLAAGASPFVELIDTEEIAEASASADLLALTMDDAFGAGSSTLILNDGVNDIAQSDISTFLQGVETEPRHNYSATMPPSASNDEDQGYSVGSEWIDTVTGNIYKCVDATNGSAQWTALGGSASVSGNEEAIKAEYDFSSPSPVIVGNLNIGDIILNTELEVDTEFDDPAATLAVGTIAVPGRFLGINENQPSVAKTYANPANFSITAAEQCRLTVNPGVSTQGAGRVVLTVRRA